MYYLYSIAKTQTQTLTPTIMHLYDKTFTDEELSEAVDILTEWQNSAPKDRTPVTPFKAYSVDMVDHWIAQWGELPRAFSVKVEGDFGRVYFNLYFSKAAIQQALEVDSL